MVLDKMSLSSVLRKENKPKASTVLGISCTGSSGQCAQMGLAFSCASVHLGQNVDFLQLMSSPSQKLPKAEQGQIFSSFCPGLSCTNIYRLKVSEREINCISSADLIRLTAEHRQTQALPTSHYYVRKISVTL